MSDEKEDVKVEVGQTLYEPRQRMSGSYYEYKVISIGRKWITLDGKERCTIGTLMRDCGGYTPQKLYTSIEAHESASKLAAAWNDLCRDLQYAKRPDGMTVDAINAIRLQLGLKVLQKPEDA